VERRPPVLSALSPALRDVGDSRARALFKHVTDRIVSVSSRVTGEDLDERIFQAMNLATN
jgi:hypothetical protein